MIIMMFSGLDYIDDNNGSYEALDNDNYNAHVKVLLIITIQIVIMMSQWSCLCGGELRG